MVPLRSANISPGCRTAPSSTAGFSSLTGWVDERRWPSPEDRFASDLLLSERIRDPWLRELTQSAASSLIPVLLGGHSLVGPGVRLLLRPRRTSSWT